MNKVLSRIIAFGFGVILSLSVVNATCFATSDIPAACNLDPSFSELCSHGTEEDMMTIIGNVLNAIYGVIAVVAVVMIVVAGIKYSTSQGDPGKIQAAKATITYAIIGLVITITAFAITNFILGALK